jgi:hypothetical protein
VFFAQIFPESEQEGTVTMGKTWDHVSFENTLRAALYSVAYKHRYENAQQESGAEVVPSGTTVEMPDAQYRVGFGEWSTDHWWVEFTVGALHCKVSDKHCELTSSDQHRTTILTVEEMHRTLKLLIRPPVSSNCSANFDIFATGAHANLDHPLPGHTQRPVYVIAHHCNASEEIGHALQRGANAIECDVRWHNGEWMIYHGGIDPEGTSPTELGRWLHHARTAAWNHKDDFALIIFDNKSPEEFAAHDYQKNFVDVVRNNLPPDLNLLFSVSDYENIGHLDPIAKNLRPNEGVAVDESHNYTGVQEHFSKLGVSNFWFGDGIAAMMPESSNIWYALNAAGVERDTEQDQAKAIKKTYIWTLEKGLSIAEYLSLARVDAVMVSQSCVGHAREIVNAHLEARMATRKDAAFQRYTPS